MSDGGLDGAPRLSPRTVRIRGGAPLRGEVHVPGDKSISHRALLVGALAEGTSLIRGLSDGEDVRRTYRAVAALGAEVHDDGSVVTVTGGRSCLRAPDAPIDCGNSGTAMRLLAGLVAGLEGETVLVGDDSLSARPMDRIAAPLSAMGAAVAGSGAGVSGSGAGSGAASGAASGAGARCLPPLTIKGGHLQGVSWTPEVASAQVKSAILFAGLWAEGETVVHEPVRTRAHTEELLAEAGATVTVSDEGGGRTVRLRASLLSPLDIIVPGDPSQAAFWVVAACVVPGSALTVRGVYAGPERTGFIDVLARMGADVAMSEARAPGRAHDAAGTTPVADITARFGALSGTVVRAAEIPSLDEVPALAIAAACAAGTTRFVGMGELRVKETDRLAAVARLVKALGAVATVDGDDLVVEGCGALRHVTFDSGGDHRMAMAAAIGALASGEGESRIDGFDCVSTSYPGFLDDLRGLGGRARLLLVAIDGPAGSGKSTVSRLLAAKLGIPRLDTGAMYRAVAWAALECGVDPADASRVADIARGAVIDSGPGAVVIDGTDVTRAIRTPEVNRAVSVVAANPAVRAALVERQRGWADAHGGGVVEGRDIGTVVFPGADLKVYLTASAEERARRRHDEAAEGVARRDQIDRTRAVSPLVQAEDALLVDTTGRRVEDVIDEIVQRLA